MTKNRVKFVCPQCSKGFEIIRCRVNKSKTHCCSLKCSSQYTANARSLKLRKKPYPIVVGVCQECKGDIIAKDSTFDKPNRKFCSNTCKARVRRNIVVTERMRENGRRMGDYWKGRKKSGEQRLKMSSNTRGKKHWNWKGGITAGIIKERNNYLLKEWRRGVFERDDYTCQDCGDRNGRGHNVSLEAHHILRWSKYPEFRYILDNGLTLCKGCHAKTDNYRGKK